MNIGLKNVGLSNSTAASVKEEYIALLEDELTSSEQTDDLLVDLYVGIRSSADPSAVVNFLNRDANFKAKYGSSEALSLLKSDIKASTEGALQDFLRWGVIGLIAGAYLRSFKRIRSICMKCLQGRLIKVNQLDAVFTRSIYLPPASEFFRAMDALRQLAAAMIQFTRNPNAKIEPVIKSLRNAGIDVQYNGNVEDMVSTDWKAIAGDWIGSFFLGIVGKVIGAHMASDKGGTLADKGYNETSLLKAAKMMVEAIDATQKMESIVPPAAQKNAEEYAAKIRFMKKAAKVYARGLKELGRGLATGLNHVI